MPHPEIAHAPATAGSLRASHWSSGRWILLSVAGLAALAVTYLADSAGEHDGLSRVDPVAAADVLGRRTAALTTLAHVLSFVGSELVVGALASAVLVALVARRQVASAATFAIGIGGSAFLTVSLKLLVARPRPGQVDRLGAVDASYSFPSGHTLNSAVFLALTVWLLWSVASATARGALVVAAVVLTVAIGASRVYLGYHWLTDVVASGVVAVAWLSILWLLRDLIARAVTTAMGPEAERTPVPTHTGRHRRLRGSGWRRIGDSNP